MAQSEQAVVSIYNGMEAITDLIKSLSNSKEGLDVLVQQLGEKLSTAFNTECIDEVVYEIQKDLKSWEETELHIAVTGETGSGKSSFINAMRGLKAEDDGAARVGLTETTLKPNCYKYPNDHNVMLWDLPGIGSPGTQSDKYYEKVDFDCYDFFIILGSKRFQDIHITLAKRIEEKMKKFYFVRSKVDEDFRNMERDYPRTFSEENVLKNLRDDCDTYFQKSTENSSPRVFLISSYNLDRFDFSALMKTVEEDLPRLKKLTFLLSLPNVSVDIIEKKKVILEKELWKIALVSAFIYAVPLPDIPVAFDATFLQKHMVNMYKSFGLDTNSLALLAKHINKSVEEMKIHIRSSPKERAQTNNIMKIFRNLGGTHIFLIFKRSLLFFVGTSIANALFSFIVTYRMLSEFLDEIAEDAKRVSEQARKSIWQ